VLRLFNDRRALEVDSARGPHDESDSRWSARDASRRVEMAPMPAMKLRIVNHSSYQPRGMDSIMRAMTEAIGIQLRHVASAWGEVVWQIVDEANRQGFEVALLDNEQQGSDYGYHDVSPHGRPYARVFLDPILHNGGRWLQSELSVSGTVSHEVCEMIGDPAANRWVQTARGALYAIELCDPVEMNAYAVRLRNGKHVSVSNFIYPAWLNPYVRTGTRLDHMGVLDKPFHVARGGYAMRMSGGTIRNIYARDYPAWRKALKRQIGARARARRSYLVQQMSRPS
jgi:hypothetical protein